MTTLLRAVTGLKMEVMMVYDPYLNKQRMNTILYHHRT